MDPAQLAVLIKQRYGTESHRTTVIRGIKKKRRSPAERPARGVHRKR